MYIYVDIYLYSYIIYPYINEFIGVIMTVRRAGKESPPYLKDPHRDPGDVNLWTQKISLGIIEVN
jgi:hypothetical protein